MKLVNALTLVALIAILALPYATAITGWVNQ